MSSVKSLTLVGLGTSAIIAGFAFTGGCSGSSDAARNGSGGTTATTGGTGTSMAGTLGNPTGGSPAGGTAAGGTAAGGASGGSTSVAGTAGTATGGSGGAAPSCTPPAATTMTGTCSLPTTTAANPVIYDGVTNAPNCTTAIKGAPRLGFWFNYGDATVGAMRTATAEFMGCEGPTGCAFHTTGCGYTNYGAGVGFDLMDNTASPAVAQPYDTVAAGYTGIQFYAMGTITGTRTLHYAAGPQTIHIKLVTATVRNGDDFGGYCVIDTAAWTKCSLTFAAATRDGFATTTSTPPAPDPAADTLDANQMLKIQLEFSKLSDPADAGTMTPVAFNVFVDDVSFF